MLCVFSQWGEIEDINLVRDDATGKSKGFCFIKFEDQRSTILAVDNFNGATLMGRLLRVDHVLRYKLPKHLQDKEDAADEAKYGPEGGATEEDEAKYVAGHAYKGKELANAYNIGQGVDLYAKDDEGSGCSSSGEEAQGGSGGAGSASSGGEAKKRKREKKERKERKKEKKSQGGDVGTRKQKKKEKKEKKEKKAAPFSPRISGSFGSNPVADVWTKAPLPPPPTMSEASCDDGDDSWRGRFASSSGPSGGGGKGGSGGQKSNQHMGGFGGKGGKGAKFMGPKFGGGGGKGGGDRSYREMSWTR